MKKSEKKLLKQIAKKQDDFLDKLTEILNTQDGWRCRYKIIDKPYIGATAKEKEEIKESIRKLKPVCRNIKLENKANFKQRVHKNAIRLISIGDSRIVRKDILTNLLTVNGYRISIGTFPIGFVKLTLIEPLVLEVHQIDSDNSCVLKNY